MRLEIVTDLNVNICSNVLPRFARNDKLKFLVKSIIPSLRAKRGNPSHHKLKFYEIFFPPNPQLSKRKFRL
jgi:hypothetical protein